MDTSIVHMMACMGVGTGPGVLYCSNIYAVLFERGGDRCACSSGIKLLTCPQSG